MLFYVILLCLIGVLVYKFRYKNIGAKISFFFLYIISTFRAANIGTDYKEYIERYLNGTGIKFEKGFYFINYILKSLNLHFIFLTVVVNFIIMYLIYKCIMENVEGEYVNLAIFIYVANPYFYIQGTFNILRQGIAMAILCYATKFITKKEYLKFTICAIVSFTMHSSSIVMFIVIFIISIINLNKKKIFLLATLSFVFNITGIGKFMTLELAKIFGYEKYMNIPSTKFDFFIFVLFIYIILLILIWKYDQLFKNNKEKLYVDILIYSLISLFVFVQNDVAYRIYIYIAMIAIIGICIVCKNIKFEMLFLKKYKINLAIMFVVMYYTFMYLLFLISMLGNTHYIPFKFIQF